MLAKAEAKQVYDSLDKMDMNERLPLPSNSFGRNDLYRHIHRYAHVKPDAVRELVRGEPALAER
jgi:hypothetical protein